MNKIKRILALGLCAGLVISGLDVSVWAGTLPEAVDSTEIIENVETADSTEVIESVETADSTEAIESVETADSTEVIESVETADSTEDAEEIQGGMDGYLPLPFEHEVDTLAEEDMELLQAGLPSAYRNPNLPTIRDQNPYGTCWAFTSTALAELSILQNESVWQAADMDLSELHLAYFTYHFVEDPLGGTTGDNNAISSENDFLNMGGNTYFAMNTYAGWRGAADEAVVPYENASPSMTLDESLAYQDAAHLKNAYEINLLEDPDAAKTLIRELGGVGIGYQDEGSCYNASYNSYYNATSVGSGGHAVTVVGWDDNFPKENFNTTAPGDGAWLIRNSWGLDEDSYYGYFWMSYYETTLDEEAYAFEFVSNQSDEYYDNNYQYDGSGCSSAIGFPNSSSFTASNIFTVKNLNEVLKAVSVDVACASVDYEVKIYTNLLDSLNPESGTLEDTVTGSTTYQGIYTIPLSKEIYLQKGDSYAVVVTLKKSSGAPYISAETSSSGWIICTASASAGQSFYKSGSTWVDYGAQGNGNIRIKAYTNNVSELTAVSGVSVSVDSSVIGVGETTNVKAMVVPSNAANQKVTWKSSKPSVATVTENGVVTGVAGGTAKITATTKDGGYTASVTVTVDAKKLAGISLSKSTAELYKGKTLQLSVKYTPSDTTSDKSVTWTSSNTDVATVSSDGLVKAKGYGYATVTAKVGSFTATCEVIVPVDTMRCTPTANNDGSVTVQWSALTGATGYYVYRYSGTVTNIKSSGTCVKKITKAKTTSYKDTSINIGKKDYCYAVFAYYKAGNGEMSGSGYLSDVTFKISYSMKGGTNNSKNPTSFTLANYGTRYTLADPTRKGYTFAGWYSDSSYKNKITSIKVKRKNLSVYAKWTENKYNIAFEGNGASSGKMSKMTKLKYSKTYALTKNAFQKKGYTFTGWNTKADGSGKTFKNGAEVSKLTTKNGKTVKLYAQWTRNKYSVQFVGNGATSGKMSKMTKLKYGKSYTLSKNTFKRSGYKFVGWNTKADGTGKSYKNKASIKNLTSKDGKTVKLYAQWKKK